MVDKGKALSTESKPTATPAVIFALPTGRSEEYGGGCDYWEDKVKEE